MGELVAYGEVCRKKRAMAFAVVGGDSSLRHKRVEPLLWRVKQEQVVEMGASSFAHSAIQECAGLLRVRPAKRAVVKLQSACRAEDIWRAFAVCTNTLALEQEASPMRP
jgi:hypothetical protein